MRGNLGFWWTTDQAATYWIFWGRLTWYTVALQQSRREINNKDIDQIFLSIAWKGISLSVDCCKYSQYGLHKHTSYKVSNFLKRSLTMESPKTTDSNLRFRAIDL